MTQSISDFGLAVENLPPPGRRYLPVAGRRGRIFFLRGAVSLCSTLSGSGLIFFFLTQCPGPKREGGTHTDPFSGASAAAAVPGRLWPCGARRAMREAEELLVREPDTRFRGLRAPAPAERLFPDALLRDDCEVMGRDMAVHLAHRPWPGSTLGRLPWVQFNPGSRPRIRVLPRSRVHATRCWHSERKEAAPPVGVPAVAPSPDPRRTNEPPHAERGDGVALRVGVHLSWRGGAQRVLRLAEPRRLRLDWHVPRGANGFVEAVGLFLWDICGIYRLGFEFRGGIYAIAACGSSAYSLWSLVYCE